jgi:hypothetical protein
MKIIAQVSGSYTLYEDDNGAYLMTVAVPTAEAAWAVYEKEYRLSPYEGFIVRKFPGRIKGIAARIVAEEKRLQSSERKY